MDPHHCVLQAQRQHKPVKGIHQPPLQRLWLQMTSPKWAGFPTPQMWLISAACSFPRDAVVQEGIFYSSSSLTNSHYADVMGCFTAAPPRGQLEFLANAKTAVHKGETCRKLTEKHGEKWHNNLCLRLRGAQSGSGRVFSEHLVHSEFWFTQH